MDDFRGGLTDPDLIHFYDYWVSLCRGRPMPSRRDIDPLQIPPHLLPNLMLIDVFHDPRRYRYRLIGTQVVTASGEDRTGQMFENVGFFTINPVVIQQYDDVVDTGRPLYSLEPFTNLFSNGSNYDVDRLLLPLSADGQRVDMLAVLFHFKDRTSRQAFVGPAHAKDCSPRIGLNAPPRPLSALAPATARSPS